MHNAIQNFHAQVSCSIPTMNKLNANGHNVQNNGLNTVNNGQIAHIGLRAQSVSYLLVFLPRDTIFKNPLIKNTLHMQYINLVYAIVI